MGWGSWCSCCSGCLSNVGCFKRKTFFLLLPGRRKEEKKKIKLMNKIDHNGGMLVVMFETDVRYVYEFVGLSTLSEHARDCYSSHIICRSAWDFFK